MKKLNKYLLFLPIILSPSIAQADWHIKERKDPFNDYTYVIYKSETKNGKFLSLTCGTTKFAKYSYPRVIIHDTKDRFSYSDSIRKLHLRVDNNNPVRLAGYNKKNNEAKYYWTVIQEGNESGKTRQKLESISNQIYQGNTLLLAIDQDEPVRFSLKGITASGKKVDTLCRKQVGSDGRLKQQHPDASTYSPVWIKK